MTIVIHYQQTSFGLVYGDFHQAGKYWLPRFVAAGINS